MPTFALIAEGHTDQVVLERIIELICGDGFDDEVEVNFLQPLRDETDSNASSFGGWELVFEYCRVAFGDALGTNDYVVVHVDTDVGDHANFGLSLTQEGVDREHADLLEDARRIIIAQIGLERFESAKQRIVFAISIHSIESWLLLCLYDLDQPKNSYDRLDRLLKRSNETPLVKEVPRYRHLARSIMKKRIKKISPESGSLGKFIGELVAIRSH